MAVIKDKKPHVLAVPLPFQGHVKPLMKLCRKIAKHGIKVTFVNIQSIHDKIFAAAKTSDEGELDQDSNIVLASIPDNRSPEEIAKNDSFELMETLRITMPGSLTELIENINSSNDDEKITCVIFDITIDWVSETAQKMGAEAVVFAPPSVAALAIILHIPKLLEEGYLDSIGSITKGESISLSEDMPPWKKTELSWNAPTDLNTQKIFFECSKRIQKSVNQFKWLLCNTAYELEPSACDLCPNLLPIGPLLENPTKKSSSNSWSFHAEDESCLTWLNSKSPGSVIYVSFGSLAVFSQQQLDELALGLELSGRDFLWVVRPDLANGSQVVYPDGFLERVDGFGKIVEWAPQEKVLSHPSVECFLSHCGWNSTMEGLYMGVPFLCWPYFSDQYYNQNYICDKWGTGLRISPDENGIRTKEEIKTKIEMLFCDDDLKKNALKMKEMAVASVSEGGSSYMNFAKFIDHLRG